MATLSINFRRVTNWPLASLWCARLVVHAVALAGTPPHDLSDGRVGSALITKPATVQGIDGRLHGSTTAWYQGV